MATHRIPVSIEKPDAGCPLDLIANQITEATSPSLGDLLAYVLADGGADEGVWIAFSVPKNYVSTPKLVIRGILDGAPSNGDDLAFGVREKITANNGAADATFAAEQTVQNTDIGGTGSAFSDEDAYEASITLTGTYVVDSDVDAYVFIDASGTTYTGNFLLRPGNSIFFEYNDA